MTDPHTNDGRDAGQGDVRDLLSRAVPTPPSTQGWTVRVLGWRRRQRILAGLTALVLLLVIPAGVVFLTRQATPVQQVASELFAGPSTEVYGNAMIFSDGGAPVLCIGPMDAMYPPNCTGPALLGEFTWADVDYEEEGEVRWSSEYVRVQGFFDPDDGPRGSFTPTEPLAPPEPFDAFAEEHEFPQLCTDPLRGADSALTGNDAENALHEALEALEVVNVWVSNGRDAYNVVIRGDAEQVHSTLREVWGGELCVESSAAATEAEQLEALERVFEALPPGQHFGGGPAGTTGGLSLDLLYLDEASTKLIREAAGAIPVQVHTELTPVGSEPIVMLD